jgi:mono/diheme cytochrome c family protein
MARPTVVVFAVAGVLAASTAQGQDVKELRAVGQGRALYLTYCASCHGTDARGALTGTDHLRTPDLTTIGARDGRFVPAHVSMHIDGRMDAGAGESEMPCWGAAFSRRGVVRDDGRAAVRVWTLTRYIAFVQQAEPVFVR